MKCLAGYNLKKLNIKGNPVEAQNSNYREELFNLIPSLEVIDGTNKEGGIVESTIYGDEENEEEDDDFEEAGEDEEVLGEDFEGDEEDEDDDGDEGDEEEEDEEQKPKKRPKH